MSKVDLRIDDLDADILAVTAAKLQEFNLRISNIAQERDKYASVVTRHLERLAVAKGIAFADHDFDIATKSFIPKLPAADPPA